MEAMIICPHISSMYTAMQLTLLIEYEAWMGLIRLVLGILLRAQYRNIIVAPTTMAPSIAPHVREASHYEFEQRHTNDQIQAVYDVSKAPLNRMRRTWEEWDLMHILSLAIGSTRATPMYLCIPADAKIKYALRVFRKPQCSQSPLSKVDYPMLLKFVYLFVEGYNRFVITG